MTYSNLLDGIAFKSSSNNIISYVKIIFNNKRKYGKILARDCPIFRRFLDEELRYASHVAGVAAGNGYRSNGKYKGIAPSADIVAIKTLDKEGHGNIADVLAGLQWLMDNKEKYNIRIANFSIGTMDYGSNDPLVKAVEYAWDHGIVMVIAAGNNGPRPKSITSPGISRKAITVGASDDAATGWLISDIVFMESCVSYWLFISMNRYVSYGLLCRYYPYPVASSGVIHFQFDFSRPMCYTFAII